MTWLAGAKRHAKRAAGMGTRAFKEMLAAFEVASIKRKKGARPANRRVCRYREGEAFVHWCGVWYLVWDNGGEVGVERINSKRMPRFFPLSDGLVPLDAGTLLCRLGNVLRGERIDFAFRAEMSLADFCTD